MIPTREPTASRSRETGPQGKRGSDLETTLRTRRVILMLLIFAMGVSTAAAKTKMEKFMEAATKRDRGAIEKLLEKGMNVNAKNSYDNGNDTSGKARTYKVCKNAD